MKELIDGNLLLGTRNGNILKLKINEIKKNNKYDYNSKLLNQIKLDNSNRIDDLIEINTNMFISHDEYSNNIIFQNNKIKKRLKNGKVFKIKNNIIILEEYISFYNIKNNFEEISKIEKNVINPTFLSNKIMIAEDINDYKIHLINVDEKKYIKEKDYKPAKSLILKNICNKWVFILERKNNIKLIKIIIINDNNNYDVMSDNNEFLIIESSSYLTNLYYEFFIICKDGKIYCYGCF